MWRRNFYMKKRILTAIMAAMVLLTGCGGQAKTQKKASNVSYMESVNGKLKANVPDDKYRTTYEIFVGSFYDSDGDGIGDLKGVEEKLDYIKDLGFNEIWLMPICPSPTYHKYDVSDYEAIDKDYGTMEDFESLVNACHKDGIKLITDLVLNHTSVEHPWFKQAKEYLKSLKDGEKPDAKKCPYVNYYNFTRDGSESGYAQLAGSMWYYEAQFWEGMPDLNLDNKVVRNEIKKITDFWLDKGVDGFRLDAVTSYYTGNEEKNIEFLKWLNDEVKAKKPDAYMVGECWTDLTTYARYYQSGIDSFFDFDFANNDGTIVKTVRGQTTANGFGEQMVTAQDEIAQNSDGKGIEAPFYTNHDMARSAGYYPGDDGSKVKFAEGLNLMMSGNAFVYYGEEIGMKGSGKDENKRGPMYWTSDSTAKGMTKGPKDMEVFDMKYDPEDKQAKSDSSILSYIKQAIKLRNAFPAIARGTVAVDENASGDDILVTTRTPSDSSIEPVAIVYNTSEKSANLKTSDLPDGFTKLSGVLTVGKERITEKDGTITLPKETIAIYTNAD